MDKQYLLDVARYNTNLWWGKIRAVYTRVGNVPAVELNNRLKAKMGYALLHEEPTQQIISLSTEYFWHNTEGFVKLVIPHELMHVAAWRLYKESGHGKDWKLMMQAFGLPSTSTLEGFYNPTHAARKAARA